MKLRSLSKLVLTGLLLTSMAKQTIGQDKSLQISGGATHQHLTLHDSVNYANKGGASLNMEYIHGITPEFYASAELSIGIFGQHTPPNINPTGGNSYTSRFRLKGNYYGLDIDLNEDMRAVVLAFAAVSLQHGRQNAYYHVNAKGFLKHAPLNFTTLAGEIGTRGTIYVDNMFISASLWGGYSIASLKGMYLGGNIAVGICFP